MQKKHLPSKLRAQTKVTKLGLDLGRSDLASKKALLEAAEILFSSRGYSAVSVRDIASQAGVNLSLVSYHFNGKEGLYREIIGQYLEAAQKLITEVFGSVDWQKVSKKQYFEFMELLVHKIVKFKVQNFRINEIMHRELIDGLPYSENVFCETFPELAQKIIQIVELGKRRKWINKNIHSLTWFTTLVGAIEMHLSFEQLPQKLKPFIFSIKQNPEQFAEELIKIFFQGVKK